MTLKEYEKLNQLAIKQQEESVKKDQQYHVENAEELAARLKREQFKKYQKITREKKVVEKGQKGEEEPSASYKTTFDAYGAQPIGKWEAVEEQPVVEAEEIDLELPKQSVAFYPVASVQSDEPPVKKFKEKTITTLDSGDTSEVPSVFKKRKFGNRNIRRANDDD